MRSQIALRPPLMANTLYPSCFSESAESLVSGKVGYVYSFALETRSESLYC